MFKKGILVLCFLILSPTSWADAISAHWERRFLPVNSNYMEICRAYLQGAAPILNAIHARSKKFQCGGYNGGLSFESLHEGSGEGQTVAGEWIQVQIQTWVDGRYCYYTAQAVDEVLFNIAARNVQSQLMCNGDQQGMLYLNFEALVPEYNP